LQDKEGSWSSMSPLTGGLSISHDRTHKGWRNHDKRDWYGSSSQEMHYLS
jgi:hypothetical protein